MCQQDMTLPSSSTSRRGCLGLNMSRWQDVLAGYSAPDLVEDETHDALKRLERACWQFAIFAAPDAISHDELHLSTPPHVLVTAMGKEGRCAYSSALGNGCK